LFKPYKYTREEPVHNYFDIDIVIDTYTAKIGENKPTLQSPQNTLNNNNISKNSKKNSKRFKILVSLILIISGLTILINKVVLPVASTYASSEEYMPVISPIPDDFDVKNIANQKSGSDSFSFSELSKKRQNDIDYISVDGIKYPKILEDRVEKRHDVPDKFYITIPKLNIVDAVIETNSTNLDPREALGHYNGSCLPDEACNTFIFGHSTFKSTPNKYKDGNYTAIFSRLDELEYGDEFFINYKGKTYRYIVELTKIDEPENVNPLEEPLPKSLGKYDNTVELFTCTPPGTTKYRLSVVGKYVKD